MSTAITRQRLSSHGFHGQKFYNQCKFVKSVAKEVLQDLKNRKKDWLKQAAEKMTGATLKDWGKWRER